MSTGAGKPIGELNGNWAKLFKITQFITPIFFTVLTAMALPWCVWVTKELNAHSMRLEVLTSTQGGTAGDKLNEHEALRMRIKAEIATEVADKLAAKIETMNANIIRLEETVKRLQQPRQADYTPAPMIDFGPYGGVMTNVTLLPASPKAIGYFN